MARDSRLSIERYGLHAEDRRERDRQREADRRIIEAARAWAKVMKTNPTAAELANIEQALMAAIDGDPP